MFAVNQKVVCINADFDPIIFTKYTSLPKKDSVYTVRNMEIGIDPITREEGQVAVLLKELCNPKQSVPPYRERAFNAERFRPLDEMTDEEYNSMSQDSEKEEEVFV